MQSGLPNQLRGHLGWRLDASQRSAAREVERPGSLVLAGKCPNWGLDIQLRHQLIDSPLVCTKEDSCLRLDTTDFLSFIKDGLDNWRWAAMALVASGFGFSAIIAKDSYTQLCSDKHLSGEPPK
jgi:hypothetical protein